MNDHSLRNAFGALRRDEAAHVPAFRIGARRVSFKLRYAFAAIVLLIAIALIPHHSKPQPSLSAWRAPTDFLLQTPGRELVESVPDMKGRTQ